ncbi:MAG: hypothetical protein Q9227_006385 [Pyrenula ochraceoflavens]
MSHHNGTIHTVRFSPNGRYLASGADDRFVLVYILEPGQPSHSTFGIFEVPCDHPISDRLILGTNEPPPVENWRIFRRLSGHDNDVQDLGWSYDGSILVSTGLDSKVVIWSGYTFEKLKTLSNHQSHVKGITFDPANKYFATASDDRTIKIFRFTSPGPNSSAHDQLNNFVLETTINYPFSNSPLTTYFRRFSWGPDGQHIAAANAVNGPVSSVAIINRGTWDGDISLIGHEAPVEVCAFSPRLYGTEPASKNPGQLVPHSTAIACAGADKSISIWLTSNPRPLIVWQDLALKPFTDIAWTPDGLSFFATSRDGTILWLSFREGEMGYARPVEENEKSLSKFGTGRKGAGVVETTNGLLLEEHSRAGEIKGAEGRMGELMGDAHASEKVNGTVHTNGTAPANLPDSIPNGTVTPGNAAPDPNQARLEKMKQKVELTKDGKKRIRPLLVSGAGATESSLPQSRLVATSNVAAAGPDAPQSVLDLSKPFDGLPKGGLASLLLGTKRKLAPAEDEDDGHTEKRIALASKNGATAILANGPEGLTLPQAPPAGVQGTPTFIRPAVLNPIMSISQVRLAVPKVRNHVIQALDEAGNPTDPSADAKTRPEIIFEARNPPPQSLTSRPQDREPCRISLTRRDQPLWQDFIPKTALLATGNKTFWAVADETGAIHIWTPAGRRSVNPFVLEAQPVILESHGPWLLCITAVGMCYVWNTETMAAPHPPVSLAPVLDSAIHTLTSNPSSAPAITQARLNSEGRIIVALSNGEGFSYSPAMFTWQRLSEAWWAVGSQYWNSVDSAAGNLQSSKIASGSDDEKASAGIIPFLERNTTNEVLLRGRAYFLQRLIKVLLSREGFESFESGTSIAHLENRVAAAMALGAKEEFRTYLLMYAKRLGAEGLRLKVEELLRTLLGGIFDQGEKKSSLDSVGRNWQGESDLLCGWKRNDILKEVVLLLGMRIL